MDTDDMIAGQGVKGQMAMEKNAIQKVLTEKKSNQVCFAL